MARKLKITENARASGDRGRQEQEPCGEQTNLFHD